MEADVQDGSRHPFGVRLDPSSSSDCASARIFNEHGRNAAIRRSGKRMPGQALLNATVRHAGRSSAGLQRAVRGKIIEGGRAGRQSGCHVAHEGWAKGLSILTDHRDALMVGQVPQRIPAYQPRMRCASPEPLAAAWASTGRIRPVYMVTPANTQAATGTAIEAMRVSVRIARPGVLETHANGRNDLVRRYATRLEMPSRTRKTGEIRRDALH